MVTSSDIAYQVSISVDGFGEDYDIPAIVDEVVQQYGLVDIDDIPTAEYWDIVARHDRTTK